MVRTRVIPCLLLKGDGLVKTVRFKNAKYVGDPINAVKIFNEKEVDELIFLDITATMENRAPPFGRIRDIASEAFMPLCYGGGVRSVEDARRLFSLGVEKVALNSRAGEAPEFVRQVADTVGSQSVVVSMDVKKNLFGQYRVFTHRGTRSTRVDPVKYAEAMQASGAGEILLNAIDRDGTISGYDLELIRRVTKAVDIPVVACGGARAVPDFVEALEAGASAVAAGSMFVFTGKHRAVLINFPSQGDLKPVHCRV